MSFSVRGPFPLTLASVEASVRSALALAQSRLERGDLGPEGALNEPGLYLLWKEDGDTQELAGFWLLFGPSYLDGGPAAASRVPPYADAVLSAATEAVWWKTLPVWNRGRSSWHPLVVLEWLPALADRCALPPPGVPITEHAAVLEELPDDEPGNWLIPDGPDVVLGTEELLPDETADEAELPLTRSLLCVIQGDLRYGLNVHKGAFALIPPSVLTRPEDEPGTLDLGIWLERAAQARAEGLVHAEEHGLGDALELPNPGRIAFPTGGWLSRDLTIQPERPELIQPGLLHERDVGGRWRRQIISSVVLTVAVVLVALLLADGVRRAAAPDAGASASLPEPAAQPALSLCSADHEDFVRAFKCEIQRQRSNSLFARVDCQEAQQLDLQAAWCGLFDRQLDGWTLDNGFTFTDTAAANACFEVLGNPYTYELDTAGPGRSRTANPDLLLRNDSLHIRPLAELVHDLNMMCDQYRPWLERQVQGAVLASHVGSSGANEAGALRELMLDTASQGMLPVERRCFLDGAEEGVTEVNRYDALCDSAPLPADVEVPDIWDELSGTSVTEMTVVSDYTDTRFGVGLLSDRAVMPSIWRCHDALTAGSSNLPRELESLWQLDLPIPQRYTREGAVQTQMELDAGLLALENGLSAGSCWQVVTRLLDDYTPLHPLLGELDVAGWPSVEQQLCGQVCASYYRFGSPERSPWVTPGRDLARCVSNREADGEGHPAPRSLDRLSMPWNRSVDSFDHLDDRDSWDPPDQDEICAFNLMAQGWFNGTSGSVLPDGVPPRVWAGESEEGGIAGGRDGLAALAAENLSSYGRMHSTATCGHAAAQCLAAGATQVMRDRSLAPYQWRGAWGSWVNSLSRMTEDRLEEESPWCSLIQPYLPRLGRLPQGELDYPCVKGVDDVRQGIDRSLEDIASRASQVVL